MRGFLKLGFRLTLCVPFCLALGCGKSTPAVTLAPVSGRVQLDGKPLAKAKLEFYPVGEDGKASPSLGPDSYADTDVQGNYTLKTSDGRDGAVVGKHKVSISLIDREHAREHKGRINILPEKYNGSTTLKWDVTAEGTKEANFALSLK